MDNKTIRRENLTRLIAEAGTAEAFAGKVGKDVTYIRNIKNSERGMGDKLARHIEQALKLGHGWMDAPHEEAPTSWKALIRVLEALPEAKRPAVMDAITQTLNPPHPQPAYDSGKRQKIQPVDRRKKRRTR